MLDGSGVQITSAARLAEIVALGRARRLSGRGARIGDAANREALDAFEETRPLWEPLGLRQRIEHAQLVAAQDVERFGRLGHCLLGAVLSCALRPRPRRPDLGGLIDGAYAYASLAAGGALIANGSDAPIEELDPLAGVRAGVRAARRRPGLAP